jgi:hypothetical protein
MADAVECAKLEERCGLMTTGVRQQPSGRKMDPYELYFSTMLPSTSLLGRDEATIRLYTDYIGHWRILKSPYIMEDKAKFPS